jgi:hypothetical protein
MTKATHKGNCQVCGNLQVVKNGSHRLALHGYTVDFGYFNGTCPGANEVALQKDRSIADSAIEGLKAQAVKADKFAALAVVKFVTFTRYTRENYKTTKSTVKYTREEFDALIAGRTHLELCQQRFADGNKLIDELIHASLTDWAKCEKKMIDNAIRHADGARKLAESIKAFADKVHGTDLIARESKKRETENFDKYRDGIARQKELKAEGVKSILRGGYAHGQSTPIVLTIYR